VVLKEYLWLFPFFSFLAGYFLLNWIYHSKKCETPALIGKPLQEAIRLVSNQNLNFRLIEEREDEELPQGTIITQNPHPHMTIKPNKTIFCMASKKPVTVAPNFMCKTYEAIAATLQELGLHGMYHLVESIYPEGTCFAQTPRPQSILETKSLTLYISADSAKPLLFPNLKNQPVPDAIELLKPYGLTPLITHYSQQEPHDCKRCIVTDQRPLSGTIVTLDSQRPLHVQLQVQRNF